MYHPIEAYLIIKVNQRKEILNELSPGDYQRKLQSLLEQHVPGTGVLFLERPIFREWENKDSGISLLWCMGKRIAPFVTKGKS